MTSDIYKAIRDVPDFPKPGIVFKDITPLLLDSKLFGEAVRGMYSGFVEKNVDKVVAIESRGFLLGAPIAIELGAGLVLARKEGKLPWERLRVEYELEYGTDALEIHTDGIQGGERVLIVDDVLATGGTAAAAIKAARDAGGDVVGCSFLMELLFLNGRSKLDAPAESLLSYE